jgi:cyclase
MRKLMIFSVSVVVLLAVSAVSADAQRNFDGVEVKATRVTDYVYMLTGAGGNIAASVGDDGILIVDDQCEPLADKIRAALGELSEGKLQFVLNTHYHGDHTGGNSVFGDAAHIVAHANVRKRLSEEGKPDTALPVITFTESLTIHFNGEEIRAVHFPNGHTDSDSVIYFPHANVVHMGDHFFSGRFPYVDIDGG